MCPQGGSRGLKCRCSSSSNQTENSIRQIQRGGELNRWHVKTMTFKITLKRATTKSAVNRVCVLHETKNNFWGKVLCSDETKIEASEEPYVERLWPLTSKTLCLSNVQISAFCRGAASGSENLKPSDRRSWEQVCVPVGHWSNGLEWTFMKSWLGPACELRWINKSASQQMYWNWTNYVLNIQSEAPGWTTKTPDWGENDRDF